MKDYELAGMETGSRPAAAQKDVPGRVREGYYAPRSRSGDSSRHERDRPSRAATLDGHGLSRVEATSRRRAPQTPRFVAFLTVAARAELDDAHPSRVTGGCV